MADPVLNEQIILASLDAPAGVETVERLQTGGLLSTINAFDRKLEREAFCQIASTSFSLHSHLARLHLALAVLKLLEQDKLTKEKLHEAIRGLTSEAENERLSLYKHVDLVTQCPTSRETVN